MLVGLLSLTALAPANATVNFKDKASLEQFYSQYLAFLQAIDQGNDAAEFSAADPIGLLRQERVARHYYYPAAAQSTPLSAEDVTLFSDKVIEVARTGTVTYEGKLDYPYIVLTAPDKLDRLIAQENGIELSPFKSYSVRMTEGASLSTMELERLVDDISNASQVQFYPQDYHQRMSELRYIGRMVINIKKNQIPTMIALINAIYLHSEFGHRVLKTAITGPKFYDRSAVKVVLYFSGYGADFTRAINEYVVAKFQRFGLSQSLLDYHPVGMYSVAKGISYSRDSSVHSILYGLHHQWGLVDNSVKYLNSALLNVTYPRNIKRILMATNPLDTLKASFVNGRDGANRISYINNPALYDEVPQHVGYRFAEALSLITARMRNLRYHNAKAYANYIIGLEHAAVSKLPAAIAGDLHRYLVLRMDADASSRSQKAINTAVIGRLQEHSSASRLKPELVGLMLGVLAAGLEKQRGQSEVVTESIGIALVKSRQGPLLGAQVRGCCGVLSVMSNKLFQRYGVQGVRSFIEGLERRDPSLIKLMHVASTQFRPVPSVMFDVPVTVNSLIAGISQQPSKSVVLLLRRHGVMVGHEDGQYYIYDSNAGLYAYPTKNSFGKALNKLVDTYEPRHDLQRRGMGVVEDYDAIFFSGAEHNINDDILLADVSLNDSLDAFGETYLEGKAKRPDEALAGADDLLLDQRRFFQHTNRPISAFSQLIRGTLEAEVQSVGSRC